MIKYEQEKNGVFYTLFQTDVLSLYFFKVNISISDSRANTSLYFSSSGHRFQVATTLCSTI